MNRSPHVNKTSREHFWLITHRRIFKWDAPAHVDIDAPITISQMLPIGVAVRTVEERPGLMCLHGAWDTLQAVRAGQRAAGDADSQAEAGSEGGDGSVDAAGSESLDGSQDAGRSDGSGGSGSPEKGNA